MILQHTMRPSIARVNEQLNPRFAASRQYTSAPISRTSEMLTQSNFATLRYFSDSNAHKGAPARTCEVKQK